MLVQALDAYRDMRDWLVEQMFFAIFGSTVMQGILGIRATDGPPRSLPSTSPEQIAARQARAKSYRAKLTVGGFDEALVRAAIYVLSAERALDDRCALVMNTTRKALLHLSLDAFKKLMRDQFFILVLDRDRAIDVLGTLVPSA